MDWTPVIGIATVLGLGGNAFVVLRSSSKTQGAVEAGLSAVRDKLDEHAAQNRRDFDAASKRMEAIEKSDAQQWGAIREHDNSIGYLRGRANGKSAGAH